MTKVDSKGRVVLPKKLRDRLGIKPGTEVDIYEEGRRVVVEPEGDPEQIIDRMEQLIAETAPEREETGPLKGAGHPISQKHRGAVRRGIEENNNG